MADQDPSPQLAQGQIEEQKLRAGGFGDDEINNWKTETSDKLAKGGFAPEEVQGYFGVNPNPDTSAMKDHIKENLQAHIDEKTKDAEGKPKREPVEMTTAVQGEDFMDAVAASFGHSTLGMAINGRPSLLPPEHMGFLADMISKIPGMVGDAPAFMAGAAAGSMVGAPIGGAVGTSVLPGIGTLGGIAGGAAVGGMSGGFAATGAIRKMLMDHYEKGDITDAHDFATRFAATAWEGIKQAGLGAAVSLTGGAIGAGLPAAAGALEKMGADTIAKGIAGPTAQAMARLTGEAITMTAAGSALEGQLPNFRDFAQNALLMGGIHGALTLTPKLMNIYRETGEQPAEIAQKAATDVKLKEDLMSSNPELPNLPDGRPLTDANQKIEVPSEEEQAKLGLKPVDENGNVVQGHVFKGKTGEEFHITTATEDGEPKIVVRNSEGTEVGTTQLRKAPGDAEWTPEVSVHEDFQRQGIATAMYDYAEKNGMKIAGLDEDTTRSADGKAFRDARGEGGKTEFSSIPDKTPESPAGEGAGGNEPPQPPVDENAPTPLSDAEKEILGKVENENPEAPKKTIRQRLKDWKISNVDAYAALRDAGAKAAYRAARTFNGVGDAIDSILFDKTRDFHTGEENGEAPVKVLQEAELENNDPGAQRLKAFMVAQTSLERDARGVESIFETKAQKDNAVQLVKDGQEKYGPYAERFHAAANRVLDYYANSGMMSEESLAKVKENNKTHLPLNTVQEIDPMTGKVGGGSGDQVVKKAVGSLADKLDPFDQAFANMQRMIEVAEKNRVRQMALDELGPELGNVLREKKGGGTVVTLENPVSENPLTTFVPDAADVDENSFATYKDGKRTVYEGDPGVITAMKALDGDHMALPLWAKVMRNFSSSLRFGTLLNTGFAGFHFFRSQTSAGLYSQTGMIPFLEPLYNLKDFITKPQMYKDFLYDGAAVTLHERIADDFLGEKVFKAVKDKDGVYQFEDPAFMKRAWSYLSLDGAKASVKMATTALFHANEALISATDNAARYTEYKRARNQGMDRDTAAFMGRNVTADYQRAGASRSALRSAIAFSNVHIQVMDRALEEMTDPEKRMGFAAKVAGKLAVPSLLLAAAYHDDPRYKEIPWYQRMLFFNVPIDHWTEDKSGETYGAADEQLRRKDEQGRMFVNDGPVLKLPVPGEPGIMFGTGLAATVMGFMDKDPRAAKEMAREILSNSVFLPIPNAVVAPLEHATNYNFFTGRQVVSAQKEKDLPFEQYNEYTSETARQIGKAIGYVPWIGKTSMASPMVIDNYIRDWTGGGGAIAVQIMDAALRKSGIAADKVLPAKSLTEEPVLRNFFTQYPNMNAQSVDDFNERFKKASQIQQTMKDQAKAGDFDGRAQTMAEYGPEMNKVTSINTALRSSAKLIQMVKADNTMSPEDKRKIITTSAYQAIQAARMGNQIMDNFEKAMKDNKTAGGQ